MTQDTCKGYVTDKQVKDGNTNGRDWKLFKFQLNGKYFTTFDAKNDKFVVGDYVKILAAHTDKGNDILTMEACSVETDSPTSSDGSKKFISHSDLMSTSVNLLGILLDKGLITRETFEKSNTSAVDMVKVTYNTLLACINA